MPNCPFSSIHVLCVLNVLFPGLGVYLHTYDHNVWVCSKGTRKCNHTTIFSAVWGNGLGGLCSVCFFRNYDQNVSVNVCTCLYMTVHVCTCLYMSVHVCSCLYMSVHVCTCLFMSVHFCTCLYMSVHVCTCLYMSVHVCS